MTRSWRGTAAAAAVLLVASVALAACGGSVPAVPGPSLTPRAAPAEVDPVSAGMIDRYGHRATGATVRMPVEIGDLREQPWSLYLEVSRAVGLDFSTLAGRPAELLRTPIAGQQPDAQLILLVVEGRPVGAWIAPGSMTSGVLAANERP